MSMVEDPRSEDEAAVFERHRRRLRGLAYRMTGSLADAEDAVQEAFLRWQRADRSKVSDPGAYLFRVVARICLDQMKSARARREIYVGPWLPEPVLDTDALVVESPAEFAGDLSVALLLALERLSPLERGAFLLHDVFDYEFGEIAEILGRDPAACRQLAARARAHVRESKPRFSVSPEEGERIAAAFQEAVASGEVSRLAGILAEGCVLRSDGGGKRFAALNPIVGRDRVARFFAGLTHKLGAPTSVPVRINGQPGLVGIGQDGEPQTMAFDVEDGRITAIYVVRNPDKLAEVPADFVTRGRGTPPVA